MRTRSKVIMAVPLALAMLGVLAVQSATVTPLAVQRQMAPAAVVEISLEGVQIIAGGSGDTLLVQLVAHNNYNVNPNYAQAKPRLASLLLTLRYEYTSTDGESRVQEIELRPATSLVLAPGEQVKFEVDAGSVPADATLPMKVVVSGRYEFAVEAKIVRPEGEITRVFNPWGMLEPLTQTVARPR